MEVVCPHCLAANRIAEGRMPALGKCGRCGERLFAGAPTEVDGRALERHLSGNRGLGVLIDVWAPWCGPCRSMAPQFGMAANRLEPFVRLLKLDAEQEKAASSQLGISALPTQLLFWDGREISRRAGAMTAPQIQAWVSRVLPTIPIPHGDRS